MESSNTRLFYLGVFLLSSATLMFEVSLTRIFSVSQWYHLAFMVVSIAFLGYGASGSFLTLFPGVLAREGKSLFMFFSLLFSVTVVLSFTAANQIPLDPYRITWDGMQLVYLGVYYVLLAVPFFFSGCCIATAFSKIKESGKVYFSDMLGAGSGALGVFMLFTFFDGVEGVLFISLVGLLSFFCFSFPLRKSIFGLFWMIVLVLLLLYPQPALELNISEYKSLNMVLKYPDSRLLYSGWNPVSRIDVIESSSIRYAPGLSITSKSELPRQHALTVDGDGLNAITFFDGSLEGLGFIGDTPLELAYALGKPEKVLVLKPGGGLDVLAAVYNNASRIDVVEANPLVIGLLKNEFRSFSKVYDMDNVFVHATDGRSFISSSEKYDLITISLAGNPITASTGIYGLNENYLYTQEAFIDYLDSLEEDGVFTVTRWLQYPPKESTRIISLAAAALESRGLDPAERIIVIRSYVTSTVIIKKDKFKEEELKAIREFSLEKGYDIDYMPNLNINETKVFNRFPEPVHQLLAASIITGDKTMAGDYMFDLSPPTDDRPFFHNYFKWDKLSEVYESMGRKWEPFFEGGFITTAILVQAVVLSALFILAPLVLSRKKTFNPRKMRVLCYFLALGLGFMLVEIPLIQKFILFLGQPFYSVSVILFSLLFSSSLGSLVSGRLQVRDVRKILLVVAALILLYIALLPLVFKALMGLDFMWKILTSFVLLFLPGFFMGMPFPLGIRLATELDEKLVPWGWCANACASVLGSVLAGVLAIYLGFSTVILLSALAYLTAHLTVRPLT